MGGPVARSGVKMPGRSVGRNRRGASCEPVGELGEDGGSLGDLRGQVGVGILAEHDRGRSDDRGGEQPGVGDDQAHLNEDRQGVLE